MTSRQQAYTSRRCGYPRSMRFCPRCRPCYCAAGTRDNAERHTTGKRMTRHSPVSPVRQGNLFLACWNLARACRKQFYSLNSLAIPDVGAVDAGATDLSGTACNRRRRASAAESLSRRTGCIEDAEVPVTATGWLPSASFILVRTWLHKGFPALPISGQRSRLLQRQRHCLDKTELALNRSTAGGYAFRSLPVHSGALSNLLSFTTFGGLIADRSGTASN